MNRSTYILLADDDADDCFFFQEALDELDLATNLKIVHNGEELMKILNDGSAEIPAVLFMDLNMPRKSGFECLDEIKRSTLLKDLPVIIYSNAADLQIVNELFEHGAQNYFRKPAEFSKLKQVISQAIELISQPEAINTGIENFILEAK